MPIEILHQAWSVPRLEPQSSAGIYGYDRWWANESYMSMRLRTSVSSIVEEILQVFRREQGKAALARAVADYYSSLAQQESEEQAEWGEFALREFHRASV